MRHDLLDALRDALIEPFVVRVVYVPHLDKKLRLRPACEDVRNRAIRHHPSHGLRLKGGEKILALGKGIRRDEQIRSFKWNDLRIRPKRPRTMNARKYLYQ